jgi:hypothetical protein
MKNLSCVCGLCLFFSTLTSAIAFGIGPGDKPVVIDPGLLSGHWIHSFEEDGPSGRMPGNINTYRRPGFKDFPITRFRMEYEFAENGSCKWLSLGADCHHTMMPGNWSVDPTSKNILKISKGNSEAYFLIMELGREILRVESIQKPE